MARVRLRHPARHALVALPAAQLGAPQRLRGRPRLRRRRARGRGLHGGRRRRTPARPRGGRRPR
ncbi:hypothetical protein DY240_14495 [Jiangella rhizosphaerae]|uniref:Uncharacterized protein n=1 Tax=Jiangella rhizosphaerae TaxID=2293569 RepID=A0A418KQH1_9ACTN|nr:hypothetical protein DY240_14495 [Jiangella rhizosphaerae]